MKVYQELTLLPTHDIGRYFLWEKMYQQLHLALVELHTATGMIPIGFAFPGYDLKLAKLGDTLRLFAQTREELELLNVEQRLKRLEDYVQISTITTIPETITQHAHFYRIQPKSNNARLARRKAKREQISVETALALLENFTEQTCDAPFVWIKSHSTGERFRLYIGYIAVIEPNFDGFNSYGLSRQSTVPLF